MFDIQNTGKSFKLLFGQLKATFLEGGFFNNPNQFSVIVS